MSGANHPTKDQQTLRRERFLDMLQRYGTAFHEYEVHHGAWEVDRLAKAREALLTEFCPRRQPPRPEKARGEPDSQVFCRCGFCDWELVNGEGLTRARPCCAEGLTFDLAHGLTLVGGLRHD